jgi:hypothetical protein
MMRRVLPVVALLALLMSGCKKIGSKKDDALAAIYKTETVPRTFTYTVDGNDRVTGAIADDYRWRVRAVLPGRGYVEEVAFDDALAVRTDDPGYTSGAEHTVAPNEWVVDPKANNDLWSNEADSSPMSDALTVLRYVRGAINESADVVTFNPQSQDYRPKFDPFPKPVAGVERYDVVPPALKPRDVSTAVGQASQLPGVRYFRRMSLYVKDGRITEIREQISVYSALSDPRSHIAARIGDYGITLPKGSLHTQARYLENALSTTAQRLGLSAVEDRTLDVTFGISGDVPDVELPQGAKRANLRALTSAGQLLYESTG